MEDYKSPIFNAKFHDTDLAQYSFLITGGAGFIGSNLVDYLIKFGARKVRVIDNLSTGRIENINSYLDCKNFEFINGDIRDYNLCREVLADIDYVSHQAALGSVPRSVSDPIGTNSVNVVGFLNMLNAVKESSGVKRMVYAASSSTYGDSQQLPKKEGQEGKPLSPYAVTKLVNELYADVFSKVYGIHTIGLRYFNIFGPRQNPGHVYAAVIPKLCHSVINNEKFTINGDGETSRDFTYVDNAVQANIKALFYSGLQQHEVFNIACGEQTTLLRAIEMLNQISDNNVDFDFAPERPGDVKHSLADISKAKMILEYNPEFKFQDGLALVFDYYLKYGC